jgi:hypothetical protein
MAHLHAGDGPDWISSGAYIKYEMPQEALTLICSYLNALACSLMCPKSKAQTGGASLPLNQILTPSPKVCIEVAQGQIVCLSNRNRQYFPEAINSQKK